MQTFLRRALAFMLKLSQRTTDPLFLKSFLDMCCLMPTSDCCCNFILGFGVIPIKALGIFTQNLYKDVPASTETL